MPHRRVPRRPSLVARFGAALAIVGLLILAPIAAPTSDAQVPADFGLGGPRGVGGWVAGQTQYCAEYPGAQANYSAFYGPYPTESWVVPWGFPVYANFHIPPYGGYWGFYSGVGPVCIWQPH
jgi:hypothetical protein